MSALQVISYRSSADMIEEKEEEYEEKKMKNKQNRKRRKAINKPVESVDDSRQC